MHEYGLGADDEEQPIGATQITADALDSLRDVLDWRSTPAHWAKISRIIDAMATALERNDLAGLRTATIELDLASPYRVLKVGEGDDSAPDHVHEQTVRLIHTLEPKHPEGFSEPR
ncbi:hypothetical protein GCM10009555_063560 [Acrocarpospora macrocephala]|uniref:CATRA-Associated Small Protein domain-containing protein n=1 Tax=Acrocarpospora macrocephala TaxID=150177 RepID=A0A5M3WHL2_9ACTN|nr:CATRA system-associated protein [Acrocarpospora macrocephala]GES07709.1 hypothetical protein Amac_013040 [Acrocarpospora macrocephala]